MEGGFLRGGAAVAEWQTMERQAANFAKLLILLPGNEPTTEGRKEGSEEQDEMRAREKASAASEELDNFPTIKCKG